MRRASRITKAGDWDTAAAVDSVLLDADDRHRRRIALTGEKGTRLLLDLPEVVSLQHGDGLVLDDGTIVRVEGKPEPLIEISAPDAAALVRLSWHLGNRHTEMQIVGETLRIRRDHVLEEMLKNLGATLHPVDAVFEPERGAYGHTHGHDHGHAHDDEHGHDHDHG
jgi:urease accessory protein